MARGSSNAGRTGAKMHQTTLRFGADLWETLEVQASLAGVSVAQYVRDAALMRIAYEAARGGDPRLAEAMRPVADDSLQAAKLAGERAEERREGSAALWQQGRLARARARRLRRDSNAIKKRI